MRKNLITTIAAAAIATGAAQAADLADTPVQAAAAESPFSAILAIWGTGNIIDTGDPDFDEDFTWGAGGNGRAYMELYPGLGIQLEILGIYEENADADDNGEETTHLMGGVHVINRGDKIDFGAFAGTSHTQHNDQNDTSNHFIGGIEAAYHHGMTSYFGQLGGLTGISGETDETWDSGIFGRLGARHFFTDYSKLEGHVALGGGDFENGNGFWGQLGIEYEHQINHSPFSLFAAYQGDYLDQSQSAAADPDDDTIFLHAFKLGGKVRFGGSQSMYSIDRHGAGTFDFTDLHMPFSYDDDL